MVASDLSQSVGAASYLADLQPTGGARSRMDYQASTSDPVSSGQQKISQEDLRVMRDKFPMLNDFSEHFLQSRTLDELLRIESTSLRIRDAERAREAEERLAQNKTALPTKYYEVRAGRDNRWSEIHPARFLPGLACSATKQFKAAREAIGLTSPPAGACYDMTSVGMGGFVTPRGWLEIGNMSSTKLKISLFNINNAAKSSSSKNSDDDGHEMKDIAEFTLALRTMRVAAQFAVPWNLSFVALENYLLNRDFCKDELKNDPNPARTLVQFCDFVLGENANHWRDGEGFLTTGEIQSYWDNFIGARPHIKAQPQQHASQAGPKGKAGQAGQRQQSKKKFPPTPDICGKWNTGHCQKAAGACFGANGVALKHVCNWRDPNAPTSPPCGQAHTRRGNH